MWLKPVPNHTRYAVAVCAAIVLFEFGYVSGVVNESNKHSDAPVGVYMMARPAREIAGQTKVATPIVSKTVQAYPPVAKHDLELPAPVQADANKVVIAASQIKPDDHPHTLACVLDTQTGETDSYVRKDPLPVFQFDTGTELGIFYGIKPGTPAVRAEILQGLFDVKAMHFGLRGSADVPLNGARLDAFGGVGIWGVWR
jgi:hypothetical protein